MPRLALAPYIVVCDDVDVEIYDDLKVLRRGPEPVDLRAGSYKFFDSEGNVLAPTLSSRGLVESFTVGENQSHELAGYLHRYLSALSGARRGNGPDGHDIATLIAAIRSYEPSGGSGRKRILGAVLLLLASLLAVFTVLAVFGYFFVEDDDPSYLIASTSVLVAMAAGLAGAGLKLLRR